MKWVPAESLDLAHWIRPGDGIVVGQGSGEPLTLTRSLVAQRAGFAGAQVFLGTGLADTFAPAHADHLRLRSFGALGTLRGLASAGALDVLPCHFSSVAALIASGQIRCDVVLLQLSCANARGEHSFGVVNDYLRTAMRRARVVIAEINAQVPWTPCDHPVRASEVHVAVATDRPLPQQPAAAFGPLEQQLAAQVEAVVPERATLQVGMGAVPEAILAALAGRRGLGLHSGMIGDAVVPLIESGAIDNAHKGCDAGVAIAGVLFGTERLYRFADRNPALRLCATERTHGAMALARLQRFVSINSALEVDVSGQVNAEAIDGRHVGAVGGQVDYVRGARLAPGGVSIIALTATGRRGESKIVRRLSGPVTTARSDVDIVATEWGIARLGGLGLAQRLKALAAIAAPAHRERLLRTDDAD